MSLITIILLLILLHALIDMLYSGYYFKKSKILAKKPYNKSIVSGTRLKPTLKILIVGDSISAGVGASSFDKSFPALIANHLGKNYHVLLKNLSVSGSRIASLLFRPAHEKQDLIVIIIASNDLLHFTKLEEFEKDASKVMEKYSKLCKKLIITGPGNISISPAIPYFLKPFYRARARKYAGILERTASKFKNVVYVDSISPKDNLPKYDNSCNAEDKFHPNDKGHKFWFDMVKSELSFNGGY